MAVKTGTQILYNLLFKEAVKKSGQASGIMSIGDSVRELAKKRLQSYLLSAQKQGVDLDKLGEQEIKYMLEMNKPKAPRVISQGDPEFKGITEALFGKRGQVIEAKFGKPFGETITDDIIRDINNMETISSMKEMNKVIKRDGRYKNLTDKDVDKIFKATEDRTSGRLDDIDPEDFADGGRTGFAGGRIAKGLIAIANRIGLDFNKATNVQKQIIQKYGDRIDDKLLDYMVYDPNKQRQAEVMASIDEAVIMMDKGVSPDDVITAQKKSFRTKNADGGVAGLLGERTEFRFGGRGYQGSNARTGKGGATKSRQSRSATPSGGGGRNPMAQFNPENFAKKPSQKAKQALQKQRQGAQQTIARQAQAAAAGQGPFASSFAPTQTKQGIGKAIANFAISRAANAAGYPTKDLDKFLAVIGAGKGLLGNIKSGVGNFFFSPAASAEMTVEEMIEQERKRKGKDTTPTTDAVKAIPDLSDPKVMSNIAVTTGLPTEIKKFDTGGYFKEKIDYPTSDAAYNIKSIQGFKRPEDPTDKLTAPQIVDYYGTDGQYKGMDLPQVQSIYDMVRVPGQTPFMAAQGGRVPFAMGKRAFLKLMGSVGAGIAGLKTGIGLGGKKAATEVAKDVVTTSGTSGPPPYFFNLVKKIKNLGDDVTPTYANQPREKVTKYKDYELTENITTGEKTIQRIKVSDHQYYDENLAEEVYMNYKPGKGQVDETMKGKTPPDEYTEDTGYLRTSGPDKGELYDTVDGIPDDVIKEGTIFEDNIADFTTKKSRKKKASGGIARMLGE